MNNDVLLILVLFASLIIGGLVGYFLSRLTSKAAQSTLQERNKQLNLQLSEKETQLQEVKSQSDQQLSTERKIQEELRREREFIKDSLTRKEGEADHLTQKLVEQKAEIEQLQEKFTKEFENLANKIMDQKSEKFTRQNKENIQQILNPLQEKILRFEKKVEDSDKVSIERHASLKEQILGLKDLNKQMSDEAKNLTKALKGDAKMRGNWGELVLERVLEKSGLEKDQEYEVQTSFKTEEGKTVFPDVIIHLPGGKKMIIDSKVSLNAYERYVNEEDEEIQERYLREHVAALKKHVNDLSAKNYHELYEIESPDFVLLFVPIEPAFAMALNSDSNLYSEAFDKNIVIVTPTTLLATLRTIDTMWQNEKQQRYAIEIAMEAGKLYDQFTLLTDDLLKVGRQMQTAQGSYETTMKKLTGKGNLIKKVEKLKKLGAKANKSIDEKLLNKAEENDQEELFISE
ncbi:DNA recombination protein RmuC [Gangjinia marincola]|uniref:DNA recombination protein RmuC n=1 Tax=Gangjinia marincola TaxID=578463 RepID=A0ABN1MG73_9FLAO